MCRHVLYSSSFFRHRKDFLVFLAADSVHFNAASAVEPLRVLYWRSCLLKIKELCRELRILCRFERCGNGGRSQRAAQFFGVENVLESAVESSAKRTRLRRRTSGMYSTVICVESSAKRTRLRRAPLGVKTYRSPCRVICQKNQIEAEDPEEDWKSSRTSSHLPKEPD